MKPITMRFPERPCSSALNARGPEVFVLQAQMLARMDRAGIVDAVDDLFVDPALVAEMRSRRANAVYLPDVRFPDKLAVTNDLGEALRDTEFIVSAVPSHGTRDVLRSAAPFVRQGSTVGVTGSGFDAGETVTLSWDSFTVLGRAKTTATGSFSTTITIPTATAGAHVIGAQGRRSFAGTTAAFTVTSAR